MKELPMLDIHLPLVKCAGVLAAAELDLFNILNTRPMTAEEAAHALGVKVTGIACLMELLVDVRYLEKTGDLYSNSQLVTDWFLKSSTVDYTPGLLWTSEVWGLLPELSQVIRNGGPSPTLWQRMEKKPEMGKKFSRYMEIFASDCVEDIQNKVNLSLNAKKLLDIGGSHGLHSIAFCKKYPQLEATIFDLPASLARTEETICHHNLQERIRTQAGNALTEDIGSGYNAILFFSLIHNHSADENRALLKKIFQSLAPGGMIIIHDYMRDQMDPSVNASFNLTLFLETGTSTFSFKEVSTWLTESGFEKIQKADLEPLAKGNIITAIKPGFLSDSRL